MSKIGLSKYLGKNYETMGATIVNGESIINEEPNYLFEPPCEERVLKRCDCINRCNQYRKVDIIRIK